MGRSGVVDQHSSLIVVADDEDLGRDSDADGVAFTEIVIDDDAHWLLPVSAGECTAHAMWSTIALRRRLP
jgi:hypothetical protein